MTERAQNDVVRRGKSSPLEGPSLIIRSRAASAGSNQSASNNTPLPKIARTTYCKFTLSRSKFNPLVQPCD